MPLNTLSDSQLVDLLSKGDQDAFDIIYRRYWKKVYNESYKRLRNAELSEDLVQDVFADLWLKRFGKVIDNLGAYLTLSVRYQVFMVYKKSSKFPFFELPLADIEDLSTNNASVNELKDCIDKWMSLQPEKRREVFRLKFIEDRSTKEISEVLHISQKTVQNQFTTSLHSLRSTLSKLLMFL